MHEPMRQMGQRPGPAEDPSAEVATTRIALGQRIATLRESTGLSVRALAAAAGVTGGFVSQVENGHAMPSIASLIRIAGALGVQVGDLFERPPARGEIRHPGERAVYEYAEHGVLDEVLSDDPTGELEVLLTRIAPGGGTGDSVYTHGTNVEMVYVLAGEFELGLGEKLLTLRAGDSVTFSGETPHGVWNRGDRPAEALWVTAPARY